VGLLSQGISCVSSRRRRTTTRCRGPHLRVSKGSLPLAPLWTLDLLPVFKKQTIFPVYLGRKRPLQPYCPRKNYSGTHASCCEPAEYPDFFSPCVGPDFNPFSLQTFLITLKKIKTETSKSTSHRSWMTPTGSNDVDRFAESLSSAEAPHGEGLLRERGGFSLLIRRVTSPSFPGSLCRTLALRVLVRPELLHRAPKMASLEKGEKPFPEVKPCQLYKRVATPDPTV